MKVIFKESLVNVFHGGYEELCGVVWVNEDFVTNGNGFDLGVRVVSDDVSLDPLECKGRRFGCCEELLVR